MPTTKTETFQGAAYDMMERLISEDRLLDQNVFRNAGGEFEIFKAGNAVTRGFDAAVRQVKAVYDIAPEKAAAPEGEPLATEKQMAFARKLANRDPALAATFGFPGIVTKRAASRFIDNMLSEKV